jgi:type IV secretory pathway TraG/TraD family ATPase VirD4
MSSGELPPPSPDSSSANPVIIEVPCFEGLHGGGPGTVTLTEETLTRHVFVAGASGAGKTTLLRAMMRQLVTVNASDRANKVGLVVFDAKGDDTVDFVKRAAMAAGRAGDVRVLSLESLVSYDFFEGCRSVSDANEYAQRLCFGAGAVESRTNFWDQYRHVLLTSALTWLSVNHGEERTFSKWLTHATSWLLADELPGELQDDLQLFRERSETMPSGSPERIACQHALQVIGTYTGARGMDPKTRSNVQATLHLALRPLMESAVQRLFRAESFQRFRVRRAVERGQILVVSIPAFLHPELAKLVGRCVKADFYRAVFSRQPGGRLAMLVADEYHLVATSGNVRYDDCTALALLRSQRAGVIAATQTLAGIDRVLGNLDRRVLLGNFGTVWFMRSSETEIGIWAYELLGTTEVTERQRIRDVHSTGALAECHDRVVTIRVRRPICAPGALARLGTGQALVSQEGLPPSAHPVWIANDEA